MVGNFIIKIHSTLFVSLFINENKLLNPLGEFIYLGSISSKYNNVV